MMMQKQQDKLQADEATLITMDKAQCADEPVVLRDGRHRKCKASQNAGSEYAAPKPQCKKLDASQADSNQKTHEMQAYRKKRTPQAQQAQMDAGDAKRHKTRKRGLFHSPNIRITCIIRNFIKSQTGHSLLLGFLHGCDLVSAVGHL